MFLSKRGPALLGIFLLFFLPACKGGSKVTLLAAAAPNETLIPKPTQPTNTDCPPLPPVSTTGTIGDGKNSDWPDQYLTPTTFAIGFKSATLLQPTTTVNPINFTIFDQNTPNNPLVIYLDSAASQTVWDSSSHLPKGTYDTIQLDVVFYEMIIPVFNGNTGDLNPHCRRVRLYLADSTDPNTLGGKPISHLDILLASNDYGFLFNWIDPQSGLPAPTRPSAPYQLPTNQLPANTSTTPNIVTLALSSPIDSSGDNKEFDITLTFDVSDDFFYDETDTGTGNPNAADPNFSQNFNYLAPRPLPNITIQPSAGVTRDGSLKNACTNINICTDSADFWPGLPSITANAVPK
jgi:hypothetical protein